MDIDRAIAAMPGASALPRKNGELVFSRPWEGRVFGMAIALLREGLYPWEDFQARLIAQIHATDAEPGRAPDYYEHWLAAFEQFLLERGTITREELKRRIAELASGEREEVF